MGSSTQTDVVAMLVALAGEDTEGAMAMLGQAGIDPGSRAGLLIAGLAGFALGMTMQMLVKYSGVPQDEARAAARDLIVRWHKGELE